MNLKQAKELVRGRLSDKRYEHTLNVKKMAVKLAKIYGEDEERAALAALLHDSAKEISKDEMREILRAYPQYAEGGEERPAPVWHGVCAAILARTQWGVTDEAVLSAIACHTAGKPGMTRLDKILYLADMTSAERDWPGVEKLRKLEKKDLDAAMLAALKQTNDFVLSQGKPLDPMSKAAYEDILIGRFGHRVQRLALREHEIVGLLQRGQHGGIQILFFQLAQLFHAGPVPFSTGHIGQIQNFVKPGHAGFARRVAGNGRKHRFVGHAPLGAGQNGSAHAVPHRGRALFAALGILGVSAQDLAHLILADLLGGIVQQGCQRGPLLVLTVDLCQLDGHFFHIQGMLIALIAQAAAHKLLCLFEVHWLILPFCRVSPGG